MGILGILRVIRDRDLPDACSLHASSFSSDSSSDTAGVFASCTHPQRRSKGEIKQTKLHSSTPHKQTHVSLQEALVHPKAVLVYVAVNSILCELRLFLLCVRVLYRIVF